MIEVQGHRGNRGALPENSLPGFAAAIQAGADMLEMDLQMTKDGVLVIHHDYHLNNTLCTYLDGSPIVRKPLVRDLTLAEIKEIDCGGRKNSKFPRQQLLSGTRIPTLAEVLELVKDKNVRLNLEIKRNPDRPEYSFEPAVLATAIVALVSASGLESRVYYSSFDLETLKAIRKCAPDAPLGLLQAKTLKGIVEAANTLKARVVSP